jgi:4-hydroxybenzoate polyprenyltransferase
VATYTRSIDRDFREAVGLFLQLNVWLAVASIVMVAVTAYTLDVPPTELGVGILLPLFLVYFVYVRERRQVPDEDRINHPYRTQLIEKYDVALHATEVVALVAYELILFSAVSIRTGEGIALLLLAHLPVAVLYFYPRLKGTPGMDSLAVGVAWSYLVVFSVLVVAGRPVSSAAVGTAVGWFLVVFAGAESRNLEDVRGDEETDNHTLAARLGPTGTKALVWTLKFGGLCLFWYLGGSRVALLVVVYLLILRSSRVLSRREKYATI